MGTGVSYSRAGSIRPSAVRKFNLTAQRFEGCFEVSPPQVDLGRLSNTIPSERL